MNPILLFFFLLYYLPCFSQLSISQGRTLVGGGLWSENVAGIANSEKYLAGANVSNQFLLPELNTTNIKYVIPTKFLKLRVDWQYFGDPFYNEQNAGLSLARSFSPRFNMGIGIHYDWISLQQQTQKKWQWSLGLQSYISNELQMGVQLTQNQSIQYPWRQFEMSLSYSVSKKTCVIFSAIKQTTLPTSVIGILNYQFKESIDLQLAMSNTAYHNHFGITFYWKAFAFDMIMQYHAYLGIGSQVGVSRSF